MKGSTKTITRLEQRMKGIITKGECTAGGCGYESSRRVAAPIDCFIVAKNHQGTHDHVGQLFDARTELHPKPGASSTFSASLALATILKSALAMTASMVAQPLAAPRPCTRLSQAGTLLLRMLRIVLCKIGNIHVMKNKLNTCPGGSLSRAEVFPHQVHGDG